MIIKWRDGETEHEFEWSGSPRTQEGRWIKERTGWSTKKFLDALEELDPDAVIALIIILAKRKGRILKWDDVDIDPVNDLDFEPSENELERLREAQAAEAALAKGKGMLPPVPDLKPDQQGTGPNGNGALSAAALSPRSEATQPSSGTDSVSTTTT